MYRLGDCQSPEVHAMTREFVAGLLPGSPAFDPGLVHVISGGQTGAGTCFSPNAFVFLCQYHFTKQYLSSP